MKPIDVTTTLNANNYMGNLANQSNQQQSRISMICICYDHKCVFYYGGLKPGKTIKWLRHQQQLIKLKQEIVENAPKCLIRHNTIIFHRDNARPHVKKPVKICIKTGAGKFRLTRLKAQTLPLLTANWVTIGLIHSWSLSRWRSFVMKSTNYQKVE